MIKSLYLFVISLIAIITCYLFIFGTSKTILIAVNEIYLILALIPSFLIFLLFRKKLKSFGIKNFTFTENSKISLKSTIIFFLIFQVVDYYYEDGFIGMISLWLMYWLMGLIGFFIIESLSYYKVYKMIKNNL